MPEPLPEPASAQAVQPTPKSSLFSKDNKVFPSPAVAAREGRAQRLPPIVPAARHKASIASSIDEDVSLKRAISRNALSAGKLTRPTPTSSDGTTFRPIEDLMEGRSLLLFFDTNPCRVFVGKVKISAI